MRRLIAILCLSLFAQACNEAYADRLRRSGTRSRGSTKKGVGLAMSDYVKATFEGWILTYEPAGFSGGTWASTEGSMTLTQDGTANATGSQSTAGLTAAALGAYENEAIAAGTDNRYHKASVSGFPALSDGNDLHTRLLINFDSIEASKWVWHYNYSAANSWQAYTVGTTSLTIRIAMNHAGVYDCNATIGTGWSLIDYYFEDLGTDGRATIFINGTATACANSGLNPAGMTGTGPFSLLGEDSSPTAFSVDTADVLFWGMRPGTITEAQHDSDASALGL